LDLALDRVQLERRELGPVGAQLLGEGREVIVIVHLMVDTKLDADS
jgi:hypothetical protein